MRKSPRSTGGAGGMELLWKPPAQAVLADAVEAVKQSDLAIVCVGLNARLEGEESKSSFLVSRGA